MPVCSEPDVDLENQYYNSKALKEKEPKAALDSFQRVLDLENGEKGGKGANRPVVSYVTSAVCL